MTSKLIQAMEEHLQGKIRELKEKSFSELSSLPEYSDDEIMFDRRPFTLAVWRKQENDTLQIVIQAYYYRFLGMGTMLADGFLLDSSGTTLPLPDDIRYEYC